MNQTNKSETIARPPFLLRAAFGLFGTRLPSSYGPWVSQMLRRWYWRLSVVRTAATSLVLGLGSWWVSRLVRDGAWQPPLWLWIGAPLLWFSVGLIGAALNRSAILRNATTKGIPYAALRRPRDREQLKRMGWVLLAYGFLALLFVRVWLL